ncbi:MerR family transcriptional regulator [Tenuibacillus multivorans]|uniref:DNA-binding transcriptional regulator, MerR family n=1 Tax=Tenuibacillus multivorans TaxID=237069 RepID=A0A1H0AY94_9BACI|nr:MerR family transcriptional regulator [Tenuibacillus multivorans]GEL77615.1 MerR family transcriptional regulator [Tenuibacillus multivorans]SDN38395.1 DNA-binding transcriptional regulator, MerR family [Tenuibacillus multivorans]
MDKRFTIGEISKLHNIPVKTLRYYDEIGLFKPVEVDEHTNYRYYSIDQFEHLNTINYLRELGISLKDIKNHFDQCNRAHFLDMLQKQEKHVMRQIQNLKRAQHRLSARVQELQESREIQFGKPMIKNIKERRIAQLKETITSHEELELALKKLEKLANLNASVYIGGVGVTRSIDSLDTRGYDSIFLMIEDEEIDCEYSTILPAGDYASIMINRERIFQDDYDALLSFIDQNKLTVSGDAIERVLIDAYISANKQEHLSEIQVPIAR